MSNDRCPCHLAHFLFSVALAVANLHVSSAFCSEVVVKRVIRSSAKASNQLRDNAWRPWGKGYRQQPGGFACDNADDSSAHRGVSQTIELNQTQPEPIVASAWSRAERVSGSPDANYSVYLDLIFQDGTHLWGQHAPFETDTHTWQQRRVVVLPEKPVRRVTFYLLFREHAGKAWFREPRLATISTPQGTARFDGLPVAVESSTGAGFQLRDVAADSDLMQLDSTALGIELACETSQQAGATFFDVTLSDTRGVDRAVTLIYALPVPAEGLCWWDGPRSSRDADQPREFTDTSRFRVGSNGRLSRYPLGAVTNDQTGVALAIDMSRPAFFRIGYSGGTQELYLAYDIALTPEKPRAKLRFCHFRFEPEWGFRAALEQLYQLFPQQFQARVPEHGLWMPFAKISQVQQWQDFGFKFKEGNNETAWDDEQGIITFRYTEPMTWWMKLPAGTARSRKAARQHAERLAEDPANLKAQALIHSGYRNRQGELVARILDTPWCDGAVWSMNSMPAIPGKPTDFSVKWNAELQQQLYGPDRKANLDGEYIDSSEGYVTDELDFCRAHFAAADTPLCFAPDDHRPAIFRGLIAFEYIRHIADDVHAMDKLMMANSTPIRLCWLAPLLDVLGSEINWHSAGEWRPMSDEDLLFRRAMCHRKPYCFLMNTRFEDFSHGLVEKYMKRSLAYGFFPGFFSHNASQGHYFSRPELYQRDRDLFKQYVPLCKRLSEAGWRPVTGARSSNDQIHLERFGEHYLTVFNDSTETHSTSIHFDSSRWPAGQPVQSGNDLTNQHRLSWQDDALHVKLESEDIAVIDMSQLGW